jgi:hypothetical protein
MATSYAGAVRNGSMAASRLHMQLGTQENMRQHGGSVDVFAATLGLNLPLILKPVCTENVVRIDLVTESHNHPGRWWRCYPFFSIC